MSLNSASLFATNPHTNIRRSRFDMSHGHTTTFNSWQLVPTEVIEVLPGDTFSIDMGISARLQTLLTPIFGNMYIDAYWFFAPNRLLWQNWQRFLGDNPDPWYEQFDVDTPQININFKSREGTSSVGLYTVADYLGCPLAPSTGSGTLLRGITHLPFRMYSRVYNEWFRSENLDEMTEFNDEDTSVTMDNTGSPYVGGPCLIANRGPDLWSRALPAPQKGPTVYAGLSTLAPVFTRSENNSIEELYGTGASAVSMHYQFTNGADVTGNAHYDVQGLGVHHSSGDLPDHLESYAKADGTSGSVTGRVWPSNLYADLSKASGVSINELRLAFATQRFYETLARSGSRYIELLESMFSTNPGDYRLQRTEFLGGTRVPINISQSVSHNEVEGGVRLGDVGAYSLTNNYQNCFTKSFAEHGYLMCIMVARWDTVYQNGYDPSWFRTGKFTYFWPLFDHIGEQPIKGKTIYADGTDDDESTFGFQEYAIEYRTRQNRVSAEMRSDISNSLDTWHLADDYSERPILSSDWLKGNKSNLDRVLSVSSDVSNQILCDMWFHIDATRPMAIRSIPGLSVL